VHHCGESQSQAGASAWCSDARVLLQAALRYGVAMLKRTGGGLRPHVQVDNAYERRLLAGANEVLASL
jgi:hypothetical protein